MGYLQQQKRKKEGFMITPNYNNNFCTLSFNAKITSNEFVKNAVKEANRLTQSSCCLSDFEKVSKFSKALEIINNDTKRKKITIEMIDNSYKTNKCLIKTTVDNISCKDTLDNNCLSNGQLAMHAIINFAKKTYSNADKLINNAGNTIWDNLSNTIKEARQMVLNKKENIKDNLINEINSIIK